MTEATCETCGKTFKGPRAAQAHGAHKRIHRNEKGTTPEQMLEQLYPSGVPVKQLGAVAEWLHVTRQLLADR